jgi:hypothetical protein
VARQKESSSLPSDTQEKKLAAFRRDDFVLLTDDSDVWIGRIEYISVLESCRNSTLVNFSGRKLLIRRALTQCEQRLDSAIFFPRQQTLHRQPDARGTNPPEQSWSTHFPPERRKRGRVLPETGRSLPHGTRALSMVSGLCSSGFSERI